MRHVGSKLTWQLLGPWAQSLSVVGVEEHLKSIRHLGCVFSRLATATVFQWPGSDPVNVHGQLHEQVVICKSVLSVIPLSGILGRLPPATGFAAAAEAQLLAESSRPLQGAQLLAESPRSSQGNQCAC